jgi:hypothetical protein
MFTQDRLLQFAPQVLVVFLNGQSNEVRGQVPAGEPRTSALYVAFFPDAPDLNRRTGRP